LFRFRNRRRATCFMSGTEHNLSGCLHITGYNGSAPTNGGEKSHDNNNISKIPSELWFAKNWPEKLAAQKLRLGGLKWQLNGMPSRLASLKR
jgi:hypothetical protein